MTRRRGRPEGPGRAELLGRVERRVEHYAETRDAAGLLEAEAETDAENLLRLVGWDAVGGGEELDVEAVLAVAWLIWLRSGLADVGQEEREQDIATSLALFTPLHEVDPGLLPAELRSLLDAEHAGEPVTGADYYAAYLGSGDPAALDEAIQLIRGVAGLTRPDEPLLAGHLSDLSGALQERFRLAGEVTDLAEAVSAIERSLELTANDDDARARRLSNLASALLARFENAGAETDLESALNAATGAVASCPAGDAHRPVYLTNLAAIALTRFDCHGDLADVEVAVDACRQAVQGPAGAPERLAALSTLCLALKNRHEVTGSAADLAEAIDVGRAALPVAPANLAAALVDRFELTRVLADLDEAEQLNRTALAEQQGDPTGLASLSGILYLRFESTGELSVLDEAVAAVRQAIGSTPAGSPYRGPYLITLTTLLHSRYEAVGEVADLDAALELAVERGSSVADADEAVAACRAALGASAPGSPGHAVMLANLSFTLRSRAQLTGDARILDEAIAVGDRALQVTPEDHPDLTTYLTNQAIALAARYRGTGAETDALRALECYERAAYMQAGPPLRRLFAARWGGQLAASLASPAKAAALFQTAVSLIQFSVPRGLDRGSQEENLARIQGLAGEVTAWSIAASTAEESLTWMEMSRGVLWGTLLNVADSLHRQAPELAARLMSIEALLNGRLTGQEETLNTIGRLDGPRGRESW